MTHEPISVPGVMVSSTFIDLQDHRQALRKAISANELHPIGMEEATALTNQDVLDSSYDMVRRAAAYIIVISLKYGQTPPDDQRNPAALSLTELEFEEAIRLKRPILLFIMGTDHLVRQSDIEQDGLRKEKLDAFRTRAKQWSETSAVHRVYSTFNSLEEFKEKVGPAVSKLKQSLEAIQQPAAPTSIVSIEGPKPPQLCARIPYLAGHPFIGQERHLNTLDEWAQNDSHSALLFEAIGGSGKSILSWNWLINHSNKVETKWTGRFWYSFYEKGAETRDFLMQVLSYMTERPKQQFKEISVRELTDQLLQQLRARPWLLVLDGIERLLVQYHRFDAAYIADDLTNEEDQIGKRDLLAMVLDADNELFRSFLNAAPSKILITSRLTPRCLVNVSKQPRPGLYHQKLSGLRPEDAEELFRRCGVNGDTHTIRTYLKENCDYHPLVIGFLAGIVSQYLPARGNFDIWVNARNGGLSLNLANLELTQRRNHILRTAISSLSRNSRELLATIAMVSSGCDYRVLVEIGPSPFSRVSNSIESGSSNTGDDLNRQEETGLTRENSNLDIFYTQEDSAVLRSTETQRQAQALLQSTVTDLEERGLLLFDKREGLYDLHPVVRNVVVGGLNPVEIEQFGGKVIDYFSSAAAVPLKEAETLEDVQSALHVVHTYLAMGKLDEAWRAFHPELANALRLNLEAYEKNIAILRPFFDDSDWNNLHDRVPPRRLH